MKKSMYVFGGIVVVIVIWIGAMFVTKNEEKKEISDTIKTEQISTKEVENAYDKLTIGKGFGDVNKTLGSPLYTQSSTNNLGNSEIIYIWGSNKEGEIGAKLTIAAENNIVVEKSVSGLYVAYDKDKLVSASKFSEIQLNDSFTKNKAIEQFGKPNSISEYKNGDDQMIQTLTWETNTTGSLGSYFVIVFTNDIATSKNEVGLI